MIDNMHHRVRQMVTECRAFVDLLHCSNIQGLNVFGRMAAIEPTYVATQALPSNRCCQNCRSQRFSRLHWESSLCLGRTIRRWNTITSRRYCPTHVVAHVIVCCAAMRVEVPRCARPQFHRRVGGAQTVVTRTRSPVGDLLLAEWTERSARRGTGSERRRNGRNWV